MDTKPTSAMNRRAHFRVPISELMDISIHLSGKNREMTAADPINLSAGGLLCKVDTNASQSIFAHRGETQVRINFPGKGYIAMNGKIRRIESFGNMESYDCAIQFTQLRENQVYRGGRRLLNPKIALETDEAFLPKLSNPNECLTMTLNYMKIPPGEEQKNARNRVYAFYETVVRGLPATEQWWFFEILDILKAQAPNYSQGILEEYNRLYKRGLNTAGFNSYYDESRGLNRRRNSVNARAETKISNPGITRY